MVDRASVVGYRVFYISHFIDVSHLMDISFGRPGEVFRDLLKHVLKTNVVIVPMGDHVITCDSKVVVIRRG